MSVLESVIAYKARKDAQEAADIQAIPDAINAYTTARTSAQKTALDSMMAQASLSKTGYEIEDLKAKADARRNLPGLMSQFGLGGQPSGAPSSGFGLTGATVDPITGEMKYSIGETPKAKDIRELANKEAEINMKSKIPSAQQKKDLQEIQTAKSNITQMEADAEKLPAGYGGIWGNVQNFFTRGESNPDLLTYNDSRPAVAVGLYKTFTGDNKLSDFDAKRALSLLWDTDEGASVRKAKFGKMKSMASARERLIQKGQYTVDKDGQFITPLQAVMDEAGVNTSKEKTPSESGKGKSVRSFNSVKEAESANLPKGTKITINGRPAEVT